LKARAGWSAGCHRGCCGNRRDLLVLVQRSQPGGHLGSQIGRRGGCLSGDRTTRRRDATDRFVPDRLLLRQPGDSLRNLSDFLLASPLNSRMRLMDDLILGLPISFWHVLVGDGRLSERVPTPFEFGFPSILHYGLVSPSHLWAGFDNGFRRIDGLLPLRHLGFDDGPLNRLDNSPVNHPGYRIGDEAVVRVGWCGKRSGNPRCNSQSCPAKDCVRPHDKPPSCVKLASRGGIHPSMPGDVEKRYCQRSVFQRLTM